MMFEACSSLKDLDLSSFDTSEVIGMDYTFYDCSSLRTLNLQNATFDKVRSNDYVFFATSNLSVIVKDESARTWIQGKLGSNGTAIIAE